MRISKGAADPALVRLAVDEAAGSVDWLQAHGFPFDPATPALVYGHEPYSRPRTNWGPEGGRSILRTLWPLWDEHVSAGRIEVLLYYSGHADEQGLLLGDDRYSYRTLRDRLDQIPADVRIERKPAQEQQIERDPSARFHGGPRQ